MDFPPRQCLAQLPTPLVPLRRLQAQSGGPVIWIKRDDLTGCALSGNKVRKLEFLFAQAIADGCGAVITCGGIQSNHCRATAIAAAQLGLKCHLILRGRQDSDKIPEGNLLLDELAGASIGFHSVKDYFNSLDDLFQQQIERYAKQGIKSRAIPTGGSDGVGVWGYINCYSELLRDFTHHEIEPHSIVCATGSGGTQAGLTAGAAVSGNQHKIIGINVCDDEKYFLEKIARDISEWKDLYPENVPAELSDFRINVIDGYVGDGYGEASDEVIKCIKSLATLEGVILDPVYTGKAFHGLLSEIERGRFSGQKDIVFIHTGGIFGIYPFADRFQPGLL